MDRKKLGRLAEDIAARSLIKKGFKIVERNFSCRLGEIDIIAMDGNSLVFVEVRSGSSPFFSHPLDSITNFKIERLQKLALWWLNCHKLNEDILRFDIVTVVFKKENNDIEIEHIKDAF